jgi:rare lipoprotein A
MGSRFILFAFLLISINVYLFAQKAYVEKGIASYYADKFDGRKTASGEIFNNSDLTAAHKKLAFGTMVKVVNIKNGQSVVVRVNDRGPYAHGRIIDLSKAAAMKIGMIQDGLAEVKIEVVQSNDVGTTKPPIDKTGNTLKKSRVISIWGTERQVSGFGVQLASFQNRESAINYGKEIHQKGVELPLIKVFKENGNTYYRVMAGVFTNEEEAEAYKKELKRKRLKGFVKTYE